MALMNMAMAVVKEAIIASPKPWTELDSISPPDQRAKSLA
jgi:hypothetical protein